MDKISTGIKGFDDIMGVKIWKICKHKLID